MDQNEKRKFITEQDVRFWVAIVIFLMPIFACYYGIRQDLALIKQDITTIKTNDLVHVQNAMIDMKARNDIQDARTIQLSNDIAKIQATLERR